jgi:hypothetical protein
MPEQKYQYGMTQYWTLFKQDLTALTTVEDAFNPQALSAAFKMIDEGLKFEKNETGATSLMPTMQKIIELSKGIGPEVSLTIAALDKTHLYHLPAITDDASLLFAILYHKHLVFFQEHTYKGDFGKSWLTAWIKKKIDAETNKKRPWSEAQAQYLKNQIIEYCTSHKINLTEADFFPEENTSALNYVQHLKRKITPRAPEDLFVTRPDSPSLTVTDSLTALIEARTLKEKELSDLKAALETFKILIDERDTATQQERNALRADRAIPKIQKIWLDLSNSRSSLDAYNEAKSLTEEKNKALASVLEGDTEEEHAKKLKRALTEAKTHYQEACLAVDREITLRDSQKSTSAPRKCSPDVAESGPHETPSLPRKKTPPQLLNYDYGFFSGLSKNEVAGAVVCGALAIGLQSLGLTL